MTLSKLNFRFLTAVVLISCHCEMECSANKVACLEASARRAERVHACLIARMQDQIVI
jgi:hypothetical protein